jgi:hypothetical protein
LDGYYLFYGVDYGWCWVLLPLLVWLLLVIATLLRCYSITTTRLLLVEYRWNLRSDGWRPFTTWLFFVTVTAIAVTCAMPTLF